MSRRWRPTRSMTSHVGWRASMRSSSAIHQSAWASRSAGQLTGVPGPVEAVLADRLQQPVLGLGVAVAIDVVVDLHEALVDEPAEQVEHRPRVEIAGRRAERLGQAEPERTRAHRQPTQQTALVVVEQVVAPRHRRQQGLLSRQRRAGAAGQQPEPLVEITGDPLRRQLPAACRGELDGQRDAVEPAARLHHRRHLHDVERRSGRARRARSRNNVTAS